MADYCTATQIKGPGRLNITDNAYDGQLAELVTTASRWIDRWCAQGLTDAFAASEEAERAFGSDAVAGVTLTLDAPLLSVASIENGDGAPVLANHYRRQPRNGQYATALQMLSAGPGWAAMGEQEVTVTGVWGISPAGATPAPIREACAMLAGWMLKRWQMALADATANQELGQIVYGEAMPKQVAELLRPYRMGRIW